MQFGYRLVTDDLGRIQYKQRPGKKKHFHLAIFVDESPESLAAIRMVEYRLHETFTEPIRHNDDRASGFMEQFYTWGKFTVEVFVLFIDQRTESFRFYLDYDLPADYGLNYVQIPVE
ncbi:MAG: hypothetical protein NDJ18_09390 [candidate division Zixibacteria bacterium]|nr:hypothetical protein [candidate division Zixibacteria bacterium]